MTIPDAPTGTVVFGIAFMVFVLAFYAITRAFNENVRSQFLQQMELETEKIRLLVLNRDQQIRGIELLPKEKRDAEVALLLESTKLVQKELEASRYVPSSY